MKRAFVVGERLYLRPIEVEDITEDYLDWVNDEEVIEGVEIYAPVTYEEQKKYIQGMIDNPNVSFFAVCETATEQIIGTCRLAINWVHRYAINTCFIGDKTCWGKGYGTEVVTLLVKHAFLRLNLSKVYASVKADNVGSIRNYEKAGYHLEAVFKDRCWSKGRWVDGLEYVITRKDWSMEEYYRK